MWFSSLSTSRRVKDVTWQPSSHALTFSIGNLVSQTNTRCSSYGTENQLVSWCFEPSQPERITSGLNKNFTLSPSQLFHKLSYHNFFYYFFLSLNIFRGHSTQEPASGRVTYFILRAYTGKNVLAISNTGKIGRGFGKNAGEWTGRVETRKEEIPGSKRSMYGYRLTYPRL